MQQLVKVTVTMVQAIHLVLVVIMPLIVLGGQTAAVSEEVEDDLALHYMVVDSQKHHGF